MVVEQDNIADYFIAVLKFSSTKNNQIFKMHQKFYWNISYFEKKKLIIFYKFNGTR